MDVTLTFTAYGVAQPAGSKRAFVGKNGKAIVTDDNRKAKPWKQEVAEVARLGMDDVWFYGDALAMFTGPLSVSMTFYVPRPKGHYSKAKRPHELGLLPSAPDHPRPGQRGGSPLSRRIRPHQE